MCESIGTTGTPFAPFASRSTLSNSCVAPSGAPLTFARPIVCSWSSSVARSQTSISMRIRRATRYVPPAHPRGLRPRPEPRRASSSASVSSSLMLFVPSLKPIRLRGVSCARLVDDVRPKPSCDQRITTPPRPMRARLRTAWNATCGSSAHACTQRSPPLCAGSSASSRERRQVRQRGRALRREAEAVVAVLHEERRAEAEGDRQPRGREPDRLAGVVRRRVRVVVDRAGRQPGGHPRRRLRPRPQQVAHVVGRVGHEVERGEVEPVLRRRRDARLVRAVERDRRAGRRLAVAGQALDAEAAERERRAARAGADQQLAAAEPRRLAHGSSSWSPRRTR